jgi:hypothetical protein
MAIERSRGKARPTLPRSRSLRPVGAVQLRTECRTADGRFGAGNGGGRGRGWKAAIAKMLGRDVVDLADVAATVAEDAWKLFAASIREMPSDGTNVRALVARKARHEALEGYWSAQALAKLGTPEGSDAEDRATQHGQRAERLSVTALDIATKLADAHPRQLVASARDRELERAWQQRLAERRAREAEARLHPEDDDSSAPSPSGRADDELAPTRDTDDAGDSWGSPAPARQDDEPRGVVWTDAEKKAAHEANLAAVRAARGE